MTADLTGQLLPTELARVDALPFLTGPDHATALVAMGGDVTYGELRRRVEARGCELGAVRRLVLLEAAHDVDSVVTYLAALAGRHPLLLLGPGELERSAHLVTTYRPDVVQDGAGLRELRQGTAHDLHPDLALLLSTSGSTGSPKLVRLSLTNLEANARSVAAYLSVRASDRAVTSLPLHYCYGLSVLNSHLLVGAGVVLTDLSVADECFWDLVRAHDVTSLSGVPHTFELLEASGFERRETPTLRYLTQAGGRMDPERIRGFAELGRRRGFDLFVMYGQTEATARMAYLPSDLVAERPEAIGVAVPGGRLCVEPVEGLGEGIGELVYEGPNVMLGYAHDPADLARGATLTRLRTGDLGRLAADGLFEVVGRRSRFAKVLGLRLDLDRVERLLEDQGLVARLVADDAVICAFVDRPRVQTRVREALAEITTLPPGALRVERLGSLPLTSTGKPDRASLTGHLARLRSEEPAPAQPGGATPATASPEAVRDLYAVLLGRPEASSADSFAALGGDSLSYVEVSMRLSSLLGELPTGWAHLTPTQLAASARRPRRFVVRVDASAVLRAVAILLVLITHADLVLVAGGAHVLLAVAGYNLARFQLGLTDRGDRIRGVLRGAWHVALPAFCWIGAVAAVTSAYDTSTVFLLNGFLGRDTWDDNWQFWFIEAVVLGYLALAVLLAVPALDLWQRRAPFGSALVVLAVTLAVRYVTVGVEAGPTERYSAAVVLWCVALGWAAAAARGRLQHALVGVLAVVATAGFFADGQREAIVVAGILVLLLDRPVPLPRAVGLAVGVVSSASLWIYLTHWQVYPLLEAAGHPYLAVLASLVVGIVAHAVYTRLGARPGSLGRGFFRTLRARKPRA
ncbi:AMP-dependent synthetase [Nocardioides psychrotolerans]|uniref:Acyl-CoA synthetase (AMP-forming)/AMP-acid ligase II n=1 Tax=Nocardioides psychrotolerans TaxID=1005945 RepID=A0A1I3QZP9_9ACTN|nr:AMP-binding protein [Nocardioides psychrotolerans]GEP40267.1 AMP-dependent synthetase [Nocardioides psychrotolerans]SFJ38546.1 Acyl-CoA synthetase (AMP-forming)/AMP-acid ligase II [Nocardioides psychrotolerans]